LRKARPVGSRSLEPSPACEAVRDFLWSPWLAYWNAGGGLSRTAMRAPADDELRDGIRLVAREIGQTCGGEVGHTNGGTRWPFRNIFG